MKKLLIIMVVIGCIWIGNVQAKEIDLSVTLSGGYDQGIWKSGICPNVTGTLREENIVFIPSIQIKYNRWKLQPTVEINYGYENFNFSNWEQYAHVSKTSYTLLGGLSYQFQPFSVYALAGITHIEMKAGLIETLPNPMLNHGNAKITENLLVFKIGAYKLWDIWKVKVGPEISCNIFPKAYGFERCRNFSTNNIVPSLGLRMQW